MKYVTFLLTVMPSMENQKFSCSFIAEAVSLVDFPLEDVYHYGIMTLGAKEMSNADF